MKKQNKAITLIALIITIVILLVLVAVTINMVLGENGLFNKAKTSVAKFENAQEKENTALGNYENLINSILGSRDVDTAALTSLINTIVDDKLKAGAGNPTGTIISYMGNTPPTGYLPCDGKDDYLISEHQALADQIKAQFGTYNHFGGNGTTTFAVPDLRGEFLRGTGTATRNTGTGENVGVHQDATEIPRLLVGTSGNGSRYLSTRFVNGNNSESKSDIGIGQGNISWVDWSPNAGATTTSSTSITSGCYRYTTRPTNTSVLYCIKE